jgi:hypothetical protein
MITAGYVKVSTVEETNIVWKEKYQVLAIILLHRQETSELHTDIHEVWNSVLRF